MIGNRACKRNLVKEIKKVPEVKPHKRQRTATK